MSDVSYPVPIRDVIIGDKTWGKCQLAELFRRARIKLVPAPPIVGLIPNLNLSTHESYSPRTKAILNYFNQAKETGWTSLYFYSKNKINSNENDVNDRIHYRTFAAYWSPLQVQQHYDLTDNDSVHETLIAFDLHDDFDCQMRSTGISPETFEDWSQLSGTPIDGVKNKVLIDKAHKLQRDKESKPMVGTVWTNPIGDQLPPKNKLKTSELKPVM